MFLKKIINSGFKSFADKITLNLNKHEITGIVGPNGSGKSNVIDSVRWVMGEQNAKMLRGEKATDIIFAGSERRKPLGMAEVTLVFDNTEGSSFCPPEYRHEQEISLTRRLYIDGQREYLINKKPCRLKDIVSFFVSTGLGGRSYSMIQQGQVDRILQAKPEEIREILEEAAGTLVFRKRKAESLKKLEETGLNLSRLEDILSEIERHKASLQDQVEKAEKYNKLSDELKEKELELLAHNYADFVERLREAKSSIQQVADQEVDLISEISAYEEKQLLLQDQLDEGDPEVQALNESVTVLRERIARAEMSLSSAQQLSEEGDERLAALDRDIADEGESLKDLEETVDEKTKELAEADELATGHRDQIETLQHELDVAEEEAQVFSNKIDEFEDEIKNVERLISNNHLRQESVEREFTKVEKQKIELEQRLVSAEEEISRAQILVDAATVKVANQKKGLDSEVQAKREREEAIAARIGEISEASQLRDNHKERYYDLRAKVASLKELEEASSDTRGALGSIRDADGADGEKSPRGLLTEFITFNDAADELSNKAMRAFETWADRILVQDLDCLDALVRSANQEEVGGFPVSLLADLFAANETEVRSWADDFDAEPFSTFVNISGDADDVLRVVQRVYHLPALQVEEDAIRSLPRGVIVVTAQGVVFANNGEYMVGTKAVKGVLQRKNEIAEAEAELKELELELAGLQGKIDELEKAQVEDRHYVSEVDRKLQDQNQEVLQVMAELQTARQQADLKRESVANLGMELDGCRTSGEAFSKELLDLRATAESYETELENTKRDLVDCREQSQGLVERRDELLAVMEQRRIGLAKSEARTQALRETYNTFAGQLEAQQVKMTKRYQEKETLALKVGEARDNIQTYEREIESHILERQKAEDLLSSKREENAGIIEELRVVENRLKDARALQQKSQKLTSDKELVAERARMVIESTVEQAKSTYHIEISSYEFERQEDFDANARQRQVNKLKNKREGLGAINMMAIDEYNELATREDHIVEQKTDILSSMEILQTAIDEIESNSATKFVDAFEILNREFQGLFPILFPGGEAQIVMTDAENPLEGGVEILVRLPGKKQQNMRLFSGGEKALTAIALIFALLKSKPTPFCFLDEVDAPLDETNVGRYNRVLEALADRFQFIVITHNRRTMEVLDTLYGVTMQEPGVSKVVGVDMSKDLPAHLKKAFKTPQPMKVAAHQREIEGASSNPSA